MLIIKLTEGKEDLEDMKRISQHICESDELQDTMTEAEKKDLSYILRPTFDTDHNEDEKIAHWQKILNEFTTTDIHGNQLRFIRDKKTQSLYFGSQEGYETIKDINSGESVISNTRF